MSTRTTGKRSTIAERCFTRRNRAERKGKDDPSLRKHIRAELQRVARQIRKLDDSNRGKHKQTIHFTCGYYQAIHEALALIRKARR